METTTIDAIKTLGFPVVACIFLGYVILKMAAWAMTTGDRLTANFERHVETIGTEIKTINPKLDRIETAIKANVCQADPPLQTGRKSAQQHA